MGNPVASLARGVPALHSWHAEPGVSGHPADRSPNRCRSHAAAPGTALGDAPNFNVGIIDPIVLPGLANCFKVTFRFVSAQGQDLGDASKAVVVTQLLLDDGVVV